MSVQACSVQEADAKLGARPPKPRPCIGPTRSTVLKILLIHTVRNNTLPGRYKARSLGQLARVGGWSLTMWAAQRAVGASHLSTEEEFPLATTGPRYAYLASRAAHASGIISPERSRIRNRQDRWRKWAPDISLLGPR